MDSLKIVYFHGHVYNALTNERIVLKEGAEYILSYSDEFSIISEKFHAPERLKQGSEIEEEIRGDLSVTHLKKIKSQNDFLYFYISNYHLKKEKEPCKESWFRIRLLEDLYIYSCKNWKNKDLIEKGKLTDCNCVVDKSENQEIPFFEDIYAKSVTSAVKMTHIHYFGNIGSPSKNSFDSIYRSKIRDRSNSLEMLRGFDDIDRI